MTDIFISYSHKDEAWKDELQAHLRVLQQHGEFSVWDDRQIRLGDNWLPEIEKAINSAKVAILMVSRDFLTSDFIAQEEITKFLQLRQDKGLRVIPLIVRPCPWQAVPWLADLQGATKDNLPLSQYELGSHELEAELSQVAMRVNESLQEAQREEQKPPTEQVDHTEEITPVAPISSTRSVKLSGVKASQKWLLGGLIALVMAAGIMAVLNSEWQAPSLTSSSQGSEVAKQQRSEPVVNAEVKPAARLAFEPEVVRFEGGEFLMGCVSGKGCESDEKPVHRVLVPPFEIGKTEVTLFQFRVFIEESGYKTVAERKGFCRSYDALGHWNEIEELSWSIASIALGDDYPVTCLNWEDAQAYVSWLSEKTTKPYRLPTETEWEFAARGGTRTPFYSGACINTDLANYNGKHGWSSGNCPATASYRKQALPVGSLAANDFGLYDMHGNLMEWVQDCYHKNYQKKPDGVSSWEVDCYEESDGSISRVLRGGAWTSRLKSVRSGNRSRRNGVTRIDADTGFRVARTIFTK